MNPWAGKVGRVDGSPVFRSRRRVKDSLHASHEADHDIKLAANPQPGYALLRPAGVGPITASARIVARADREMIVEAVLVDAQGVTVADATARLRVLQKK
jgi:hypothetical protein